jgi:dTDP-4-dehydrorhamnose reductase
MPAPPAKPLIWITGAGGLIGHALAQSAPAFVPDWDIWALTRDQLELTDFPAVQSAFRARPPALIVHCAAVSRGPACEAQPKLAWRINVELTRQLVDLAAALPLVFLSSDLVFDGRQGHYREGDPVHPLSLYAATKVAAEEYVLTRPHHLVVRTSLNGGTSPTGDHGFNEELRRAWREGRPTKLFVDEFRSPLAAEVTARAIWALTRTRQTGLFHVGGRERLSRWEIGQAIAARWPALHPKIEPVLQRDYDGPPRPPDTSLDCAKAQAVLPFDLPGFREWLARHPEAVF